jgi:copper(I)-binding protein
MTIDAYRAVPRRLRRLAVPWGLVLTLLAPDASALFVVNQPWVRPAGRGQSTEAYMNLTSTDGATLVSVRSDDAGTVAIRVTGNVARTVPSLPLPPGSPVALAPGKHRLMLTGLARRLRLGERLALTLTIESTDGSRQDIPVFAEVRRRSPLDDEMHAHHAHPH